MEFRSLTAASAVIAVGVMTIGAGVTAASVIKPATHASRPTVQMRPYHRRAGDSTGKSAGRAGLVASQGTQVRTGICTSPSVFRNLSARLSADIQRALRGRA